MDLTLCHAGTSLGQKIVMLQHTQTCQTTEWFQLHDINGCYSQVSIDLWLHNISVFLLPVRCNHHHCDSSRDMDRNLIMGLPIRDSTPPVMDNILHEVSSIRQYLEKRQACRDIAKEWLQVGYVLDVLLFRVYLLAMLAYSITLGTLWSVWQYA